jgi:ABC-type Na+ efflux pump permease subunit
MASRGGTKIVTMQSDAENIITAGLATIRRKRRFVWIIFFLYLPAVMLFGFILRSLLHSYFPKDTESSLMMGVALFWMALFTFAIYRASFSKCPRCGKNFNIIIKHRWSVGFCNPFARSCLNCGLKMRQ